MALRKVSLMDYGMGLFETLKIEDGRPIELERHLKRLKGSCEFLGIDFPDDIREMIFDSIERKRGIMKIILSDEVKISFRDNPYSAEKYEKGFALGVSGVKRGRNNPYLRHKTTNYMVNYLEHQNGLKKGYDEVLFLDMDGCVLEGTKSNIFIIKNDEVFTASAGYDILPGTMRNMVIERFRINEATLFTEDLLEADTAFLTNAVMGVMPVSRFGDKKYDLENSLLIKIMEEING